MDFLLYEVSVQRGDAHNVLIHGHATIDDAIVWEVAIERLPGLLNLLSTLLDDL